MKKKITKVFSFVIAILVFIATFSVSAFATNDYGFSVNCPKNYDENKFANFDENGYFNSYYEEWVVAEDGSEYYTGNTVDITVDLPLFYDELKIEDYYDSTMLEWIEESVEGWSEVTSTNQYYMNAGDFSAVAYDVFYQYHGSDENGKRKEYSGLYSEIIVICGVYEVTIDIDICDEGDLLQKRNQVLETFANAIEYDAEIMAEKVKEEKLISAVFGAVLVVAIVVGIVIFIIVLKSSKKKKEVFYPYNNMNIPPQYGSPYGQMPYGNPQGNKSVQIQPSDVETTVNVSANDINEEDSK